MCNISQEEDLRDWGAVSVYLDSAEVEMLLDALHERRRVGRPGYPLRAMLGLTHVKATRAIPTWRDVVRLAADDAGLREVLGCDRVPSEWACYRFARQVDEIAGAMGLPAVTRKSLGLAPTRAQREEQKRAREQESMQRIAEYKQMRRRGQMLPWQLDRPRIGDLPAFAKRELETLIAQQDREAHEWIGARRGNRSLDAMIANGDSETELYELFEGRTAPSAEEEFFAVEAADTIEHLAGATDHDYGLLRDRFTKAGISLPNVQRKEHDRLRLPLRHRGSAPPPVFQRMSTSLKHRKPGGPNYRSSRKPRRSWRQREKVVYDWKAAA